MKPVALQNAIMAAALKKRNKVESGAWKEPEVKTHRVTKEELEEAKRSGSGGRRPQVPSTRTPIVMSPATIPSMGGGGNAVGADVLRQIEKERQEFKKEKEQLLNEMRQYRNDMNTHKNDMSTHRNEMKNVMAKMTSSSSSSTSKIVGGGVSSRVVDEMREEIDTLKDMVKKQAKEMDDMITSFNYQLSKLGKTTAASPSSSQSQPQQPQVSKDEMNQVRAEMIELRKLVRDLSNENKSLREQVINNKVGSTTTDTNTTTAADATKNRSRSLTKRSTTTSTNDSLPITITTSTSLPSASSPIKERSRSKSKGRDSSSNLNASCASLNVSLSNLKGIENEEWPHLLPHTAERMMKYQARDEKLKEMMSNPKAPGMYPRRLMSVQDVEGMKLVFFQKKIYIPEKLRPKSLSYYFETYEPAITARQKLRDHCIWPTQEQDIADFERLNKYK